MTIRSWIGRLAAAFFALVAAGESGRASPGDVERGAAGRAADRSSAAAPARITVLYDAFGRPSGMRKDWGYAALLEVAGKRILFDTGDNAEILARNVRAAGTDLSLLDFVVVSHRHGDHMAGLRHVLDVNPDVKVYAPSENFGVFGFSLPGTFYRRDASLPPEQRYYDGAPPDRMIFGSAWQGANVELVTETTEVVPGVHLIAHVSDKSPTLELRELSLAIETPRGLVVVVGCSHPGVERILESAAAIDERIHLLAGGLHLVVTEDPEIERLTGVLRDGFRVEYVAPGHCTGEPAFAALRRAFGDRYLYAGLGSVIAFDRGRDSTERAAAGANAGATD
jgi:7,8-dihydropterin-6-yl-methyl-4-(beta-D-ribofuranosyl)aminobenzene 5'-phosphate synthase